MPENVEARPADGTTPLAATVAAHDVDVDRLRRGLAEQVIAEHRRELRRLSGDIDRLSMSTTTTGSLVEELASDLGRELDRVRAASAAWAQESAER